jgi:prepilin-type N-terminal cleavage/methylation domain-containing protein
VRASSSSAPVRGGFTLPELVVVITLGLLLVFAVQKTIAGQRRFYASEQSAAQRHETIRVASAVLSGAFREANIPGGDVVILAAGRVRVREPLGLAFVCGTDGGSQVGAVRVEGRWVAGVGDSVLIRRATGWNARRLSSFGGPVPQVPCVAAGGSVLALDQTVADAVAGSAVRAFRSRVYEVAASGADYWLYRVDGAQRDLLAGPLEGAQGFQVWYENGFGVVLSGSTGAQRVGMRVVARAEEPPIGASPRRDTVTLTFTGRNR